MSTTASVMPAEGPSCKGGGEGGQGRAAVCAVYCVCGGGACAMERGGGAGLVPVERCVGGEERTCGRGGGISLERASECAKRAEQGPG